MTFLTAVPSACLRGLIHAYRLTFSAWLGRQCRFGPSCSEYALEAVETHGAWKGGLLAARRVARCHPWGGSGYDPVPPRPTLSQTLTVSDESPATPPATR